MSGLLGELSMQGTRDKHSISQLGLAPWTAKPVGTSAMTTVAISEGTATRLVMAECLTLPTFAVGLLA